MLLVAAVGLCVSFLLAIHLCRGCPGTPAFTAVLLLLATPLFFTQAMMAQLDMPAMMLSILALLLFIEDRFLWSAAARTVLVLVKETGAIEPVLFGA
jgi:predicted membrane-bound dolichyl-phosphate-mannose-protein mannosyltransferase